MTKKNFDARLLENPPRPRSGFNLLFDSKVSGLALRVPANGTPAFQVIARDQSGHEKRIKIAEWVPNGARGSNGERLTLDDIRTLAIETKLALQTGLGRPVPPTEVTPEWTTMTLREALDLHISSGTTRERIVGATARGYRDALRLHAADWLDIPMATLERRAVRERHGVLLASRGPSVANNVTRIVSACWNRAARQYPELGPSPTLNVDLVRLKPRDYGVREHDVPDLWRAINRLDPIRREFYRTLMLTGLRRASVSLLRVTDLDAERGYLRIAKPKGGEGKAFTLPLCNQLHELLARRAEEEALKGTPWLFPARSASGHIVEPKVAGLLPPHGFRHLYSSVAGNMLPAYPLKQLLNHALDTRDVTAGYVKLTPEQLKPHVQAVADHYFGLINSGTVRSVA